MALVGEAGRERDLDHRDVGRRELPAGEFDPQLADIVAQGAAVLPAEDAGEVHGMDADRRGDLAEGRPLRKAVVEQLAGPAEPGRRPASHGGEGMPCQLGQDLEEQPFQGER